MEHFNLTLIALYGYGFSTTIIGNVYLFIGDWNITNFNSQSLK